MAIKAVLFDLGGTIDVFYESEQIQRASFAGLQRIFSSSGIDLPEDELYQRIISGNHHANKLADLTLKEPTPEELLTMYCFPDMPELHGRLTEIAEDVLLYYDTLFKARGLRMLVPEVLSELRDLGFRVACTSNVKSRTAVSSLLKQYRVHSYFEFILSSCEERIRKPHPDIFLRAANKMGLKPMNCAYVGDSYRHDVFGSKQAGYGLSALIPSPYSEVQGPQKSLEEPDLILGSLMDLVDYLRKQ